VDGIANRSMERLDPSDIETITVLKRCFQPLFTVPGSQRVILTTKRGQMGKPEGHLTVNGGFNQPTRIPDMANAAQYATMMNEIDIYRNRDPRYSADDIQKYSDGSDPRAT
jgi:hypothetical protein